MVLPMNKYYRKLRTVINAVKFKWIERKLYGVKFIFKRNNSDTLLICFSALPPTNFRIYNNIIGFENLKKNGRRIDRLYICDSWGFRGSYYYFEHGSDLPYRKTSALIEKILTNNNYSHIYTAGTSKGGTSAIILGLKYNASDIFAGACQYYIGKFLNVPCHYNILDKMISNDLSHNQWVEKLDSIVPTLIQKYNGCDTRIHLIYSKKEQTYEDHIKDLIDDAFRNKIIVIQNVCDFVNHNDVGHAFIPYVQKFFSE